MKTPTITNVEELKSYFIQSPIVIKYGTITSARTNKQVVQKMLLENEPFIQGGNVYYFNFRHLGLDVYEVKPRPKGLVNSWVVDKPEQHSIVLTAGSLPTLCY